MTLNAVGLQFRYAPDSPLVIRGLDLTLSRSDTCLLVGGNGSGKSTLGHLLCGLAAPTMGTVHWHGVPVSALSGAERVRTAMYVGQVSYLQFFRPSLRSEVEFTRRASKSDITTPPWPEFFALPSNDRIRPLELSVPQMWRFQLFLAHCVVNPQILFVDEVVSPAHPLQARCLNHVLSARAHEGQITVVAYQRMIVSSAFTRELHIVDGSVIP